MNWRILENEAKKHLRDSTHDWGHTQRVLELALRISAREGGDREVLRAAALLHDIGYFYDEGRHGERSALMSKRILARSGFPSKKISAVLECILSHRFAKGKRAESIETKILQDADRLDAIGAWGIARCFLWTGERKGSSQVAIDHFHEKLLKLKAKMNTKTARSLAKERHAYMQEFLRKL